MIFFWLLLLAHGIADFLFQTDSINSAKCRNLLSGYARHGLAVFLCTLAAVHFYGWVTALLAGVMVTITHICIDWTKNIGRQLTSPRGARPQILGLILDQAAHIFVLFWVWHLLDRPADRAVTAFYATIFTPVNDYGLFDPEKLVSVSAIYVLVAFGGAVMIRMTLDQLSPEGVEKKAETRAGKYIGILERMLILTLAATNSLSAIGFVFAAKSIARFDEISRNRDFAEYYLIGTLLSFLLALAGGLLLQNVL